MRIQKNIILFLIVILGISLWQGVPLLNKWQIENTKLTKVYSNGWYGYTIRYPEDGSIYHMAYYLDNTDSFYQKLIPSAVEERVIPHGRVVNDSLNVDVVCDIRHSYINDSELTIEDYQTTVSFNNMNWRKRTISPDYSNWKAYSGTMWQTNINNLLYRIETSSGSKDQLLCEKIVSTFELKVDPSIPRAIEAETAKKVALSYAAKNYPDKIFITGSFYDDQLENNIIKRTLDQTNTAVVVISDITNLDTFPFLSGSNPIAIKVVKRNGVWSVDGILEPQKVLR